MEERMLLVAKQLAETHGVFFAASFLADQSVPLELALPALTAQESYAMKSVNGPDKLHFHQALTGH